MTKIFVEYQILPQHRPAYSTWMEKVRALYGQLEVYEGSDQPGLFVEMWDGLSADDCSIMKEQRKGGSVKRGNSSENALDFSDVDWGTMAEWVQGGAAKIHIWHFTKVR